MSVRFTNTLGGAKKPFRPAAPPLVTMYVCGPTVYDVPHIGHARAAVVFDVVRRHLTWRGYEVFYVQNLTDVDDKIIAAAAETSTSWAVVAERNARAYGDAIRALGVLPADVVPRAGGHIPEMVEMISTLIDHGYAYETRGSVYYAVDKFDGYGKLSGQSLQDLRAGDRVEPEPGTISPADFALWKAAKPGEPSWPSPWGRGRPGWHIECSAMATRYLGPSIDIHGGGSDLIFPHHENEIAQTEAACGVENFARVWLHNGHVQIHGEKMSKSLRNYVVVDEVLRDYPPQVLRLFLISAHYRSPIDYSPDALTEAAASWERFTGFLRVVPDEGVDAGDALDEFAEAMDDDLHTPRALAALYALVAEGHRALEAGRATIAGRCRAAVVQGLALLGLEVTEREDRFALGGLVTYLLELRARAREARDFALADEVRDRLALAGVVVEDTASGPRWHLR